MSLLKPTSFEDRNKKIIDDVKNIVLEEPNVHESDEIEIVEDNNKPTIKEIIKLNKININSELDNIKNNIADVEVVKEYQKVETYVINKFLDKNPGIFHRDITFEYNNEKIPFDGLLKNGEHSTLLRVKILKTYSRRHIYRIMKNEISMVKTIIQETKQKDFLLHLIFVILETDVTNQEIDSFMNNNESFFFSNVRTSIYKYECILDLNRVARGFSPPAPTPPCKRVRTGRFTLFSNRLSQKNNQKNSSRLVTP